MDGIWIWASVSAAVIATFELFLLDRRRRMLLLDPRRRRFFVRNSHPGVSSLHHEKQPALGIGGAGPSTGLRTGVPACAAGQARRPAPPRSEQSPEADVLPAPEDNSRPAAPRPPAVALLYVDSEGSCAAANEAARRLLHWREEEGRLRDVLSGIGEDIALLLDRVARESVVQRYPAELGRPYAIPVEIDAIALRDRDSNFWGTALFVRMRNADVIGEDSGTAPSPQLSSTPQLRAASVKPLGRAPRSYRSGTVDRRA